MDGIPDRYVDMGDGIGTVPLSIVLGGRRGREVVILGTLLFHPSNIFGTAIFQEKKERTRKWREEKEKRRRLRLRLGPGKSCVVQKRGNKDGEEEGRDIYSTFRRREGQE